MAVKDGLPATDFSRMNREWVKAVAEGGSGGGGLPEITEADEGKFLGVVSGEAAWATAGGGEGGSDVMLINITDTGTALQLDKTFTEIATAIKAKKICYAGIFVEDEGTGSINYMTNIVSSVQRDPDHGEHDPEFTVRIGGETYACTSADAYPKWTY